MVYAMVFYGIFLKQGHTSFSCADKESSSFDIVRTIDNSGCRNDDCLYHSDYF
jgi:hypothetical protein